MCASEVAWQSIVNHEPMAAVFCVLIHLFLPRQGHLSARFGTLVQKLWSGRFSALHPQAFKTTLGLLHPQFSGSRQVCVCSGTLSRNVCDSLPLPLFPSLLSHSFSLHPFLSFILFTPLILSSLPSLPPTFPSFFLPCSLLLFLPRSLLSSPPSFLPAARLSGISRNVVRHST